MIKKFVICLEKKKNKKINETIKMYVWIHLMKVFKLLYFIFHFIASSRQ